MLARGKNLFVLNKYSPTTSTISPATCVVGEIFIDNNYACGQKGPAISRHCFVHSNKTLDYKSVKTKLVR